MGDLLYSELDNLAYELLCLQADKNNRQHISQIYFTYNRYFSPYSNYYEMAKIQLRVIKLNKIKDEIQNRRQTS